MLWLQGVIIHDMHQAVYISEAFGDCAMLWCPARLQGLADDLQLDVPESGRSYVGEQCKLLLGLL